MANRNNTTSSYNRRSNYKKKAYENNQSENTRRDNEEYEFNSFRSYRLNALSYYAMMNVFDLYKPEQIRDLIRDPMANNQVLREISRILYGCNGVYTNTVDYMVAIPTLDNVIVPYGESKQKKKRNRLLMQSTLKGIKHKEIVRDALFRGMVDGIAFYYFETSERPLSREKVISNYDVERIYEIN